jgi:hypothetical protein
MTEERAAVLRISYEKQKAAATKHGSCDSSSFKNQRTSRLCLFLKTSAVRRGSGSQYVRCGSAAWRGAKAAPAPFVIPYEQQFHHLHQVSLFLRNLSHTLQTLSH